MSTIILGNLEYVHIQHEWAVELGNFLACYELLFNSSTQEHAQQGRVLEEINYRLRSHGIHYNIPNIRGQPSVNDAVKLTLESVRAFASPAHCAFVLIGEAVCFLRENINAIEHSSDVIQVARSRIQEIRTRCIGITLDCDAFWEVLSSQSSKFLTSHALIQLLQVLRKPLNVLLISASPKDTLPLLLGHECRELEEALRASKFRDAFRVSSITSCRIRDITRALDDSNPSILQFSGHGNCEGLVFENDAGTAQVVQQEALARLLKDQEGLQLVILNACSSLNQAQVIADAVGHAIAMEERILDRDAINFTREFYRALGNGRNIEVAFRRAVAASMLENASTLRPHLLQRQRHGV